MNYKGKKNHAIKYLKNIFSRHDNIIDDLIINTYDNEIFLFEPNYDSFKDYLIKHKKEIKYSIPDGYVDTEDFPLDFDSIIENDIICNDVFDFLIAKTKIEKIEILYKNNNNKTNIFPKHKKDNGLKPENFRWLFNHSEMIKLVDRIFVHHIQTLISKKSEYINNNIFKSNIKREKNYSCQDIGIKGTESLESVILLDFKNAFDSPKYSSDIYDILYNEFKILTQDENKAKNLCSLYLLMINNRKCYFHNTLIKINKGIPQGLSSSTLIFTIIFKYIIDIWEKETDYLKDDNLDMTIYIDDIYIKIKINDYNLISMIIYSFEDLFSKYNFHLNYNKCKADDNLRLTFDRLTERDFYLGIPFTREKELYCYLILKNFKEKNRINNRFLNWRTIQYMLLNEEFYSRSSILGFFSWKLKPILPNTEIGLHEKTKIFINNIEISWYDYGNFILSLIILYTDTNVYYQILLSILFVIIYLLFLFWLYIIFIIT